jgi:putative hydrolase of the HAD superfamily
VLKHLGLAHLFDETFAHRDGRLPAQAAPEHLREAWSPNTGSTPPATAFFEDSEKNLAPAAELGMTTVLVGAHAQASTEPFVHHRTHDLPGS